MASAVFAPIEPHRLIGLRGGGQAVRQAQLQDRPRHQKPAYGGDGLQDVPLVGVGNARQMQLEQDREQEGAGQNGDGGGGLRHAVGPGQTLFARDLPDVAVFRRRIERALHRQQQGHGERCPEPAQVVEQGDHAGQAHRAPGGHAHHPMFGVFVRQVARGGEQQREGQEDQGVHYGCQQDQRVAVVGFEHGVLHGDLVSQIHKGVQEDHDDVGEEPLDFEQVVHSVHATGLDLEKNAGRGLGRWRREGAG